MPDQVARDLETLGSRQVEAQAFLAAVVLDIHRCARQAACVRYPRNVAIGVALDLDDLGSVIGEVARAGRTCDQRCEFEDADTIERARLSRSVFVQLGM